LDDFLPGTGGVDAGRRGSYSAGAAGSAFEPDDRHTVFAPPEGGIPFHIFRSYGGDRNLALESDRLERGLDDGPLREELLLLRRLQPLLLLARRLRAGYGLFGFLGLHHDGQLPFLEDGEVPVQ
jgi:hypothetical protein